MGSFYLGKYRCIFCALLLAPALTLSAQSKNYSLVNLIDSAKNHLPVLMQKQALIDVAKATVTDTRHSFLPRLEFSEQLNIGSANSLGGSFFTFGITPSTSGSIRNENTPAAVTGNVGVLYGEYELVNFGLNDAKIKKAEAYVHLQETDLKQEQYFVTLNVARLYFNLLKNQYKLGADQQNIERYQHIYTIIRALTASGIKAGSDSSLAKAELSKTKITYNQTLGMVTQLKEQMAFLTGVPAKSLMIDTIPFKVDTQLPGMINLTMDTVNNPLIDYYSSKRDIFLANEHLIRKSYLPKIILAGASWARGSSVQFNDQYKSLSQGLGYQRFNYDFGLAFSYNLFNGIHKKDKLAINRYQLQASEWELQQQKLALFSSSRQAENALQTTIANLKELPVQLQSAQDTYQQKLAQYKAGIISLIDLTNASFVLYRSQTDYIETLNDWYLAQLDQAGSTGNLPQFIQTIK